MFFVAHAGIFMGVHFAFLWALFSGGWASRIHGPREFVDKLIIGTDLWIPLLVLFVARGIVFFYSVIGARLQRWLNPQRPPRAAASSSDSIATALVGGFYARIIVMHVAILLGGFLSFFGSIAPLIILIAIKTAIDLGMHLAFDLRDADKTFRALMRHGAQQRQGGGNLS